MSVIISLSNAYATTASVSISLVEGSYVLGGNQGVSVIGTCTFNSLSITKTSMTFGVDPGTTFHGTIRLDVAPAGSGAPVILLRNLDVSSATVTYPTQNGPETEMLTPDSPLTLRGFVVQ